MTVSYQYDVASSSTGGFFRLLWRWRGSIWKLLYREMILFVAIFVILALSYDFLMTDYYKRYYEKIVIFCSAFVELIPLSFILGFYVSFTATRWWNQYTAIPWPDKLMNALALYVPGNDETSRILRRTLMRYLNLTLVLVLRSISIPVKRRFPTKEHLIEAGFMTKPELEMYTAVPSTEFNTFWIPCTWFINLLREMKMECRITDSAGLKLIMEEFNDFRNKCGLLWSYDWVSIPLVYTQVVTLSTHAFFVASLIGRQHINPPNVKLIEVHPYGEFYIPVFTLLQFILYMGLLKLGEQLINPFGDDDEDFELNWIIDRHLKVSFLGVDVLNIDPPPLMKDQYFDDTDIKLPYTEAAVNYKIRTYRGSVAAFHVPQAKHALVVPDFDNDNGNESDDDSSASHSTAKQSLWSAFGAKLPSKLSQSQSISSFNSEAMVEDSTLEPLWRGSSGSIQTLDNPGQMSTNESVSNMRNSQASGIRGETESKGEDFIVSMPPLPSGESAAGADATGSRGTSGTSTPTINLDVPYFTKEFNRFFDKFPRKNSGSRTSSGSSVNKSSSQLSTSSVQQIIEKSIINVRRAHSSANKKFRGPKISMFKGSRPIDPQLKIRPYKSRVTFSDDTKRADDKDLTIYYLPMMEPTKGEFQLQGFLSDAEFYSNNSANDAIIDASLPGTPFPMTVKKLNDHPLRRQSADETNLPHHPEPGIPIEPEPWLHHQSLPNIQEVQEEEPVIELHAQSSPVPVRKISIKRNISDRSSDRCKTFSRQSSRAGDETIQIHDQSNEPKIEEKTFSNDQLNESAAESISQELLKCDDSSAIKCKIKASPSSKNRQSSTESDTGSYHTACSFLMQISEDSEDIPYHGNNVSSSSIESYKSAIDVSKGSLSDPIRVVPMIKVTNSAQSSVHSIIDEQIEALKTDNLNDKNDDSSHGVISDCKKEKFVKRKTGSLIRQDSISDSSNLT